MPGSPVLSTTLKLMMKFSKTLLLVLGVVAALAFVGVMIYAVIKIDQQWMIAISNRSAEFPNPRNWALIGAGLGLLAGLLLGMGLVMPNKSFKARYAELRKAEVVADAEAAGYHGARSATRPVERTSVVEPDPEPEPDPAPAPSTDVHQADPKLP